MKDFSAPIMLLKKYSLYFVFVFFVLTIFFLVLYNLCSFYMMGPHAESYWIFSVDTPFRLTLVWQVLKSESFPPSSLSNLDVSFYYHYGGPAIVAFFHEVTGFAVDKLYFYFVLPSIFILTLTTLYTFTYSRAKSHFFALFAVTLLFLVNQELSLIPDRVNHLYQDLKVFIYQIFLVNHPELSFSEVKLKIVSNLFDSAVVHEAGRFANTVQDISPIMRYSAVVVMCFCFYVANKRNRILLYLIFTPILFTLKSEMILLPICFLFFEVATSIIERDNKILLCCCAILIVCLLACLSIFDIQIQLFNYAKVQFYFANSIDKEFAVIFLYLITMFVTIKFFGKNKRLPREILFLGFCSFAFLLLLLFDFDAIFNRGGNDVVLRADSAFYIGPLSRCVLVLASIFAIVDISARTESDQIVIKFFAFIFFLSFLIYLFFKTIHVFLKLISLFTSPDSLDESANLISYQQCLSHVPVESVVYANSFDLPTTRIRKNNGSYLSSFFGHQSYASNSSYEKFPFIKQRIAQQQQVLNKDEVQRQSLCELTGGNDGYFLIDKREQSGINHESSVQVYSNKICSIFYLSSDTCQ